MPAKRWQYHTEDKMIHTPLKYLTDAEIQELLVQSDGELSDIDDPDFENIPESTSDFRSGLEMPVFETSSNRMSVN
ncbi:hypothetical protein TNCT_684261 [Trichonephila clavata]|uniref:Uncharacterized protein n=1 Tax=Trichonephila clavata TaxID=2740835 RepID=A0A8X6FP24_TRICU|nr:hypothetical protein TNCT_684261 [Trichonephila clavata]